MAETLLEQVQSSLAGAAQHNPGNVAPPAAILWTDADGQWKPLVRLLRPLMPELLTLGDYNPEESTGPAIWLRCVIEPHVREESFQRLEWLADAVPVIYMPHVSRQTLRATEDCPPELRPLVELQYRGVTWKQRNGRDWTVEAFLVSKDGGLGLDVARDGATKRALQGALSLLALTPIADLQGKHLEVEDFNRLMIGDEVKELLNWLSNPSATRSEWDDDKWSAFREHCRDNYGFDPESDGELVGAEKLGSREGAWSGVWQRFAESPRLYPGIPDLLRRATPSGFLFDPRSWPGEAEKSETELRAALMALGDEPDSSAREKVLKLEEQHGERRSWVWAQLEMCPLASALSHLAVLAEVTQSSAGGHSIDGMAQQYRERGYRADYVVLQAIASVKQANDLEAVNRVIRALYLPWLEDAAARFQQLLLEDDKSLVDESAPVDLAPGDCLLFVDGLRYDLGERLAVLAEERGAEVARGWRWAALPTVTATGKPAVTPAAADVWDESNMTIDFTPQYGEDQRAVTADQLRKMLSKRGIEVIDESMLDTPQHAESIGWTECGQFDKLGHNLGIGLAQQTKAQLEQVLDRVLSLLVAGWRRVRVVTDHGWMLMPGGLQPVLLPKYLTESRWTRCAAIKDTSHVEVPVFGWSWNPNERFATAPGAHAFHKNKEYAHGGVSLQECVLPDLTFSSATTAQGSVIHIEDPAWAGLRCRVKITPASEGFTAAVRMRPNDPSSTVSSPKSVDAEGKVSLLVSNEDLQGSAACVVVLDGAGRLVAQKSTVIGGDG